MGKAIRWIAGSLAVLALVAGGTWFFWPHPNAPKRADLSLKSSSAPTRHVAPAIRADLQTELDQLGYKPQAAVTADVNGNEVPSTSQLWNSPGRPQVELNDLGSGIYRLHTVSFAGGAGSWKNFWCSPAADASLTYATNFGKQISREIADGSANLTSDVTTPEGTMFVRWSTLTCYVSNS